MSYPYGQNPEPNSGDDQPGSGDQPSYGQTPPPPSGPSYGQTPPPPSSPSYGQTPPPPSSPSYGQTPPPPSDSGYTQPPVYGQPPSYGQPPAYGQAPYEQPQGYGQNPYGGYAATTQAHPQGTAILVLGIVGIVVCGIAAVVALVMGNKALKEIDANPSAYNNRQMVVVGRILGIVGTVLWAAVIIGYIIFFIAVFGQAASS